MSDPNAVMMQKISRGEVMKLLSGFALQINNLERTLQAHDIFLDMVRQNLGLTEQEIQTYLKDHQERVNAARRDLYFQSIREQSKQFTVDVLDAAHKRCGPVTEGALIIERVKEYLYPTPPSVVATPDNVADTVQPVPEETKLIIP